MHELDVPVIVAIERTASSVSLERRDFRDCLRVGYVCRLADVGGEMAGLRHHVRRSGARRTSDVCIRG